MQIKIFTIPVCEGEAAVEHINRFLRGHKVLEVEQQLIQSSGVAYWSFCIRYITPGASSDNKKKRKDYKQLLSEADFVRFSELRKIRKQIAQEDGIPAFAVFSDEELAGLAALKEWSPEHMKTIKGIGEKKVEKYAGRFLKALTDEKNK